MANWIYSGRPKPPDAFVAVGYEGYRFWIVKSDAESTRTMS